MSTIFDCFIARSKNLADEAEKVEAALNKIINIEKLNFAYKKERDPNIGTPKESDCILNVVDNNSLAGVIESIGNQEKLNKSASKAHIFIALFKDKIGEGTESELTSAIKSAKNFPTGKKLILVLFQKHTVEVTHELDIDLITKQLNFMKKLYKDHKSYFKYFNSNAELAQFIESKFQNHLWEYPWDKHKNTPSYAEENIQKDINDGSSAFKEILGD